MSEVTQSLKKKKVPKKVPGYFYSKFYKSISSNFGVITPPLRAYTPTNFCNSFNAFGVIAPPLRVICVKKIA